MSYLCLSPSPGARAKQLISPSLRVLYVFLISQICLSVYLVWEIPLYFLMFTPHVHDWVIYYRHSRVYAVLGLGNGIELVLTVDDNVHICVWELSII